MPTFKRTTQPMHAHIETDEPLELACQRADQLATEIASTDDSQKMFKAYQTIKSTKHPPWDHSHLDGKFIGTDQGEADAIHEWLAKQFSDQPGE